MNSTPDFQPLLDHPVLQTIQKLAQETGATLYLVGGAVRDWCLSQQVAGDLDLMILNASAAPLAQALAEALGGRYVLLDESFGIHRVVLLNPDPSGVHTLDISDALENSLEKDLGRRDLTCNAMALHLETGSFVDPFQGLDDLAQKQIRMVAEANLVEDPLRLLRVFRLGAQLQAKRYDAATLAAVSRHRDKLLQAAGERLHYEFLRLLSVEPCFPSLQAMAETGLLEVLLPELRETRTVPPNDHHHLWLFDHTLELVNQAEKLFPQLPAKSQERIQENFNPFTTRFGLVKLACLLHDIGKPATMVEPETDSGRTTFYGHEALSEEMSEGIFARWKVSSELAILVKKLVRWHLYPCQFGPESPRKSILRFFRRIGPETPDLVLLALADRFSTRGPAILEADLTQSQRHHIWLLEQYEAEQETLHLPRLLSGHEIMQVLALPPGPQIGKVLAALEEAHQLGEVTTAEAAKSWLLEHIQEHPLS